MMSSAFSPNISSFSSTSLIAVLSRNFLKPFIPFIVSPTGFSVGLPLVNKFFTAGIAAAKILVDG